MKLKSLLIVMLILVPLTLSFSAGGQEGGAKDQIHIGIDYVTFTSPYASAMVKAYRTYAEEKGVKMTMLDSQLDIQKEAANMDTLIGMRPDVIIIAPVDAEGSRATIRKAIDAGIPVICSNVTVRDAAELGVLAFTGPNCYLQAEAVAKETAKLTKEGNAVMITGTPGYSAANDREKGFTDTIPSVAPGIKMLDIQSGNWMREEAQRVMSDYVTKYGDKIDIVYTHDDNMTVGAINALKAAGYTSDNRPVIVSVGGMADGLPAVKDGWIDFTISQSPVADAQISIDVAIDVATGKFKGPYKDFWMDMPPVTKANVQKYIDMGL